MDKHKMERIDKRMYDMTDEFEGPDNGAFYFLSNGQNNIISYNGNPEIVANGIAEMTANLMKKLGVEKQGFINWLCERISEMYENQ